MNAPRSHIAVLAIGVVLTALLTGFLAYYGGWLWAACAGLIGAGLCATYGYHLNKVAAGPLRVAAVQAELFQAALEDPTTGIAIMSTDGTARFVSDTLKTNGADFSADVKGGLVAYLGGGATVRTRIEEIATDVGAAFGKTVRFPKSGMSGRRASDIREGEPDINSGNYRVGAVRLTNGALLWTVAEETESERETDALASRLSVLSKALEQAPFGVVSLSTDGTIRDTNQIFRELTGLSEAEGRAILDFVVDEDRAAFQGRLDEALESDVNAAPPLDVHLAAPGGGDEGPVVTMYLGRAASGRGRRSGELLLHVVDATERRRLETQFAQSQKMQAVGQLAGGVAHDFNNMLTAMIGFCDLLLQRHQPGEASFGDAMQIKHNANRAAGLVRQLLAFSREQNLDARPLDITELLAELSQLVRRLLGETVELSVVHGRDLWPVRADPGKIEQMIINLAVNARDAMPSGGQLTIQTDNFTARKTYTLRGETLPPGEYVSIAVSDIGQGMSEETLNHLFEPFFTTKEVGEGTGLGLAMVYGNVKQMGGCVFAHSDGPDKGSRIMLYLPRSTEAVDPADAHVDADSGLGDVTGVGQVLLVEDEDGVRLFSARALRSKGYQVTEARTGEAALEILEQQRFDLLLTDMVMPKVDGATLIRRAREKMPDLPVVCISGYTRESMAREIDGLENLRFLSKPFSLKQLAATVKGALESNGEPPQLGA